MLSLLMYLVKWDRMITTVKGLCFFYSTVGTVDQPGYWPKEYFLGLLILVVFLMLLISWKADHWYFRSRMAR